MTQQDDVAAIRSLLQRYELSLNTSDTALAVKCYTEDGVFMAPGIPTAEGTAALQATYSQIFKTIGLSVTFDIDEVTLGGEDLAFALTRSHGKQTTLANGQVDDESNREVFILRKQAGQWRFARYLFNQPT